MIIKLSTIAHQLEYIPLLHLKLSISKSVMYLNMDNHD